MAALDPFLDALAWLLTVVGGITLLGALAQGLNSYRSTKTLTAATRTFIAGSVQILLALFLFSRDRIAQLDISPATITGVSLVVIALCGVVIAATLLVGRRGRA